MASREFDYAIGAKAKYEAIGFNAYSVRIDNNSNQWLLLNDINVYISPYTIGAVYPLGGNSTAQFSFTAKPGTQQAAVIAGELCTITYSDYDQAASAGQTTVVRAPSTEWRNPKGLAFDSGIQNVTGTTGNVTDWTYTVPTGRRARVDTAQAFCEIGTTDGSGAGTTIESKVSVAILGGVGVPIITAAITQGTVLGARADIVLAAGKELQAGDVVRGVHLNGRSASVSAYMTELCVITEGDA